MLSDVDSASPQLGTNLVLHSVQLCGTHLFGFFFPEVLGLLVVGGQRWIFVLLGVLGVGFGCGFVFVRGLLFLILYGYLQFFYALCKEQCLTERLVTQD